MGNTNTFLTDCSQRTLSYPKDLRFFFELGAHPRACYFILLDLLAPTLYAYIGSNISKENSQFIGDGFVHNIRFFSCLTLYTINLVNIFCDVTL